MNVDYGHGEIKHHHQQQKIKIVPILNLESTRIIAPLGRGAKGVVFHVKQEPTGEFWALKVILRDLVQKKSGSNRGVPGSEYKRIYFEQQVLSRFNHPLLPKLRGVLSTHKIVAYAIDYCPGSDLNSLRKQQSENMFSIDSIRFYAAELVLALEHLHKMGIAYRDLKPENIMVQENGHIMLVDFDLSTEIPSKSGPISPTSGSEPSQKKRSRRSLLSRFCSKGVSPDDSTAEQGHNSEPDSTEKSNSFVGTEEYVAPEMIQGKGHGFAVDWWSLGVVIYEMLYGVTPFKGVNRKETFYRILSKNPDLVGEATALRDLIRKMLIKDPKERITVEGIKGHEFFKEVDWDLLLHISRPPYIPAVENWSGAGKEDIDVEMFVQGIFAVPEAEVGKKDDDEKDDIADHEDKLNKKVWVDGLDNRSCEAENFLVF